MPHDLLSPVDMLESVAGEEDPGASLDLVRGAARHRAKRAATSEPQARIHFSCSDGEKNLAVEVVWPRHPSKDVAHLLGMVMAHHGAIADRAWSLFDATGKHAMELEVDEGADGVFYISSRDD